MKTEERTLQQEAQFENMFFLDVSILILEIYFAERRSFTSGDSDSNSAEGKRSHKYAHTLPTHTKAPVIHLTTYKDGSLRIITIGMCMVRVRKQWAI